MWIQFGQESNEKNVSVLIDLCWTETFIPGNPIVLSNPYGMHWQKIKMLIGSSIT